MCAGSQIWRILSAFKHEPLENVICQTVSLGKAGSWDEEARHREIKSTDLAGTQAATLERRYSTALLVPAPESVQSG